MLQASPLISLSVSPSFNNYSSSSTGGNNLAEIAARVVSEFRRENPRAAAAFLFDSEPDSDSEPEPEPEPEFEFAAPTSSPIPADEIFLNGQIRPVYPVLGKGTFLVPQETAKTQTASFSGGNDENALPPPRPRRQPLRKLMVEEERATCSTSSEAIELDGLRPGTYSVWAPNKDKEEKGDRKKSKSTGTASRRWKLRDLILSRSSSDVRHVEVKKKGGKVTAEEEEKEEKRPCKKDIVGILANVNGLSRNLHPF